MSLVATLLLVITMVLDTAGQLALKASAIADDELSELARWKVMAQNKWLWIGVFSYVFEFFSWLAFLSVVPLAQGVMVGSINIIVVMIGGRIFFKETLSPKRITAIGLIAVGVALAGWA